MHFEAVIRTVAFIVSVAGVACSHPAKSSGVNCSPTVTAMAKGMVAADNEEKLSNLNAVLTNRCVEDKWSGEAQTCLTRATTQAARRDCTYKHMTREQNDKLDRATRPFIRPLDVMVEFKDKMCACKDQACAQTVSDDMTKWSQEMAKEQREPPKLSDEEMKQASELGEQMGNCMQMAISGLSGLSDLRLKVTRIEPDNGDAEGGTYVHVFGNRFIADGARNAKVYFGSRQGTVSRFVNDGDMIVEAPGGKPGETVDVLIIFEPGGELKVSKGFTFKEKNQTGPSIQDRNTKK